MSRLGLHAQHLRIHGTLDGWERGSVRGVTLHLTYAGTAIGDAVLLWNTDRQRQLASDTGFGLERIRWVRGGQTWPETVFGDHAHDWPLELLDAVRTATLLIDNGIRPGTRGPSHTLRKVINRIPRQIAATGLSRLVREAYGYWRTATPMRASWPVTSQLMEQAVLARTRHSTGLVHTKPLGETED